MKYVLVLFAFLALTGCTTVKMADQPRQSPIEALASFNTLGFGEWAQSPFVRTEALCGAKRVDIKFLDIKHAIYSLRQATLTVGPARKEICSATHVFALKDKEDANRLIGAANSLGARVDYLIVTD